MGHALNILRLEFQGTTSNCVRETHEKALVPQVNCPPLLANGIQTCNACKALEMKGKHFVPPNKVAFVFLIGTNLIPPMERACKVLGGESGKSLDRMLRYRRESTSFPK